MSVLALDIAGFRIRIDAGENPAVAAALREYVAAFEVDANGPGDPGEPGRAGDDAPLAPLAEVDAETLAGIAAHPPNALHLLGALLAPRFVLLHAGLVVAAGSGAVAFAGKTGSGKTTASMVAERLGHPLLGDDLLLLEWQTGRALALPTARHVRPWTAALLDRIGGHPAVADRSQWRLLERLVVFDDAAGSLTDSLLRCTFGVTPATAPDHLRRLLRAVAQVDLVRVPPLVWRETDTDVAATVQAAVRGWLAGRPGDGKTVGDIEIAPGDGPLMTGVCRGISMHPAIRIGQTVTIRRRTAAPAVGDVVVFRDPLRRRLTMHRVLALRAATGANGVPGKRVHTRGDNSPGGGEEWPLDQMIGVVEPATRPPSALRRAWVVLRHALGRMLRVCGLRRRG